MTWVDVLSRRPRARGPCSARWSLAVVAFVLAANAVAQEPSLPQPVFTWRGEEPAFFRRAFFSRQAGGEPLQSRGGELAERWGYYIWSARPLWLVVETDDAPKGTRLCVEWSDPNGEPAADKCERLPTGRSQLSFEGPPNASWPVGRYAVHVFLETGTLRREREQLVDISYAIGEELAATAEPPVPGARPDGPPRDGPPRPPRDEIPTFPWPPPQPTTQTVLDRALLTRGAEDLGDVAQRLTAALAALGYSEHSFYAAPGGFALVTRLEQIEFDGTPKGEPLRWSAALPPREVFSLSDFIGALFSAPEGHYRVLVFVVSDRPFAASGAAVGQDEALAWLRTGFNALPSSIANVALESGHVGTALIYQFRKVGQQRAAIANPDGAAPAVQQLERSGILSALGR